MKKTFLGLLCVLVQAMPNLGLNQELILVKCTQVSTLDGNIHALDESGEHKWSLNTGKPFLSSYYSEEAFKSKESPYLLTLQGELLSVSNSLFYKSAFSIKELVDSCPTIKDQKLHLGEKRMRAYTFDSATGEVLGYFENYSRPFSEVKGTAIFVGMVDYLYSVLDLESMETIWNITYTEIMPTHKENFIVADHTEFSVAVEALKNFGSITGIMSLEGENLNRLPLGQEGALVKVSALGQNMYAQIIESSTEGQKVFPLVKETNQMLEGDTPQSTSVYLLGILVLVVLAAFFPKQLQKPKSLTVDLDSVLGQGSQGTTVFEGTFQQRPVAVKRMLKNYIQEAKQEIQILLKADGHPNVVNFYAWEEDSTFVYIAFEKCCGTLSDFVEHFSMGKKKRKKFLAQFQHPPHKLNLLKGAALGLAYIHSLNIVHRDIKPMNILIDFQGNAKIADMASGKTLKTDQSSFGTKAYGSLGWQSPEVLLGLRRTKAVDVFSLGCTFYYCLTNGKHPFGERIQRETNILNRNSDLSKVNSEAKHLIGQMIQFESHLRPPATYIAKHPLFWSYEKKLNFMLELSDKLETNKSLLELNLESECKHVLKSPWNLTLDPLLLKNLGKYRRYNFTSVKDLLRVIRNKKNHYHELPQELKDKLGQVPEEFYRYFECQFPELFEALYSFLEQKKDPLYKKYLNSVS
mgnify:FL=1